MSTTRQQLFCSTHRSSQSLCSQSCQNILYKSVFEHLEVLPIVAALLLSSKSFQNSSFGANYLFNFVVDQDTVVLFETALAPSSCLSLQFIPSLSIECPHDDEKVERAVSNFIAELVDTPYLSLQLRSLALSNVVNGDVQAFFASAVSWPRLQSLSMQYNGDNDDTISLICQKAPNISVLNLNESWITNLGLERVATLSKIVLLKASCCYYFSDVGLEHVAKLSGISTLNLCGTNSITDIGLGHIALLTEMTDLDLSWCYRISDAGMEHIAKLSNLSSLAVSGCNHVNESGLELISNLSDLRTLDLSYCEVTDRGLESVSKLSNMTCLNLAHCYSITNFGLEHLSKLSGITSLNLSSCFGISDAGLEHVAELTRLATLNLVGITTISDCGLQHLHTLAGILILDLVNCSGISEAATREFKAAFPKCEISTLQ